MKTLTLVLPETLELDSREATMILASKLYEQGKLSSGQAAELAGYSKRTFLELLGNYGVSLFKYDASEIESDIKNAAGYNR